MYESKCDTCKFREKRMHEFPCCRCSQIQELHDFYLEGKSILQQDIDSIKKDDLLLITTEYEKHKVLVTGKYNDGLIVYAYGEIIRIPYNIIKEVKWL